MDSLKHKLKQNNVKEVLYDTFPERKDTIFNFVWWRH